MVGLTKQLSLAFVYLFSSSVLLLSGCAPSYEAAKKDLASASSCCLDYSEFVYEVLPQDKPLIFDINKSSPAFDFSSGKSFFKALVLPDRPLTYKIKIRSYSIGMTIPSAHIFYPKIIFLDDDFAVQSEGTPELGFKRDDLAAMKENFGGPPLVLFGEVLVWSTEQKYLLILTTDELLSHSATWFLNMGVLRWSPLTVPEGNYDIPLSPFGRIVLEVEDVQ